MKGTSAVASATLLWLCVCLAAASFAVPADDVLGGSETGGFALVEFLQADLVLLHFVLALPRSSASHTSHAGHTSHTLEASSHTAHSTHTLPEHLR